MCNWIHRNSKLENEKQTFNHPSEEIVIPPNQPLSGRDPSRLSVSMK